MSHASRKGNHIVRFVKQICKMLSNWREDKNLERYFESVFDFERQYAQDGDASLDQTQIAEIDRFWSKYSFAYPKINYNAFQVYMNRTGIFSPLYIPSGIRKKFIEPYLQNKEYYWSLQNKSYLPKLLSGIRQPRMLVCRISGYYFNEAYERISLSKALQICLNHLKSGKELVLKPNGKGGGCGVQFFKEASDAQLKEGFQKTGLTFVVQDVLRQAEDMRSLNPSSVNTVRVCSMMDKGQVVILGAVVRVGAAGKRVDNWHAGGAIIGVASDGKLFPYGLLMKNTQRVTKLPGGVQLSAETPLFVPGWEKVTGMVKRAHIQLPYIKLIGWDIAIEEDGLPTCIEVNFANDISIHQLQTGPMFGDYTERLLDQAIYKRHSTLFFDFREYHDHVEIEKYMGGFRKAVCPRSFRGKPVTVIRANAFRLNTSVKHVVLPESIVRIGAGAFWGCENLTDINIPPKAALGQLAFFQCPLRNEAPE